MLANGNAERKPPSIRSQSRSAPSESADDVLQLRRHAMPREGHRRASRNIALTVSPRRAHRLRHPLVDAGQVRDAGLDLGTAFVLR